jgi:glutamate mutase epsilon subunit
VSGNLLARRLQECLRSGAFDDVALARVMNHAIGGADLHPEAPARRTALIAMATAIARDILRHRRRALLGGRFIRAWFLTSLLHTVLEWAY